MGNTPNDWERMVEQYGLSEEDAEYLAKICQELATTVEDMSHIIGEMVSLFCNNVSESFQKLSEVLSTVNNEDKSRRKFERFCGNKRNNTYKHRR